MRILFVLKQYYPRPTPPGICVQKLQECFLRRGINSDVLMQGEKEGFVISSEYGNVYSINEISFDFDQTKRDSINNLLRKYRLIKSWPCDVGEVEKYITEIKRLDDMYSYDAIIGVCLPTATAYSAVQVPKGYVYELDSITNNPELSRGIRKLLRYRLIKIENHIFSKANHIFYVKHNEQYYLHTRYNKYRNKMTVVDIPLLIRNNKRESELESSSSKENNITEMIYAGGLFKEYRNPQYLLELLEKLSLSHNFRCRFYSRGDCEDLIGQAAKKNKSIEQCGYVEREIIEQAIQKSDLLISLGNKLKGEDRSLPSKVIEYMASGRAILHIDSGETDTAVAYLKKYELALILNSLDPLEYNIKQLQEFLIKTKEKVLEFDAVKSVFKMNTPDYTVDKMLEVIF